MAFASNGGGGPGGSRFSGSPAVRPSLQANAVAVAQPLAFPRRLLLPSDIIPQWESSSANSWFSLFAHPYIFCFSFEHVT